jgi:adhesin transport system outer membrane protein
MSFKSFQPRLAGFKAERTMNGKSVVASVLTALLLISGTSLSFAQPGPAAIGLPQVVGDAILSNPEIRARHHDLQSSLEAGNVARGGLLPQVTAQGWAGREWRSNVAETPSYNWDRPGYSLELRQLLFDGFTTVNSVKQLGFEKLAAYYELIATTDTLAGQAVDAYLDVQRYREMELLARDNFAMHETTLGQLRERQESGVGRGVDLEQAYGRRSLAQTNLMTESNNLNDVVQRFRRIVGEYPADVLPDVPDIGHLLPDARTQDFGSSLRQNPSLLAKQSLVQAAEAGRDSAVGRHMPTLELRASTGRDREQPTAAYRDVQSSRVQLMLSYNLYRGGADQARVRQTTAQRYAASDVRDYTCRNIQQELSLAWNNIVRLRAQIPFLREHELATGKVRIAYRQQFQIGQRSLLDLLNTENELFDSQRALVNGIYDLKQAEYRWLALSHRLLPALGLTQPHEDAVDENNELSFPEENLQACLTPLPDTRNMAPVVMEYRSGDLPPIVQMDSSQLTERSAP